MTKLMGWIVAVVVVFVVFRVWEPRNAEPLDAVIVGMIGTTFLIVGIVMIVMTRTWTARGLGLVSAILGTAVLYLGTLAIYLVPETARYAEVISDATRALLLVGGPLVLYGIVRYLDSAIFTDGDADEYRKEIR